MSTKEKKWVNRGFLHGPILPIYGAGATAVLVSTMAVSDNVFLVFLYGMIGATIMEYFTGWAMEKLFHVRYWDYSSHKFNLNGHICLLASLCWGAFSVLMTEVIHVPVEGAVLGLGTLITEALGLTITIITAVDISRSLEEAMDLREMLEKLNESKNYIHTMQRRLEIVSAFTIDEYKNYRLRKEQEKISRRERMLDNLNALRSVRKKQLDEILERIESISKEKHFENLDLDYIKKGILAELEKMGSRRDKEYNKIASLLRRNPKAQSEKFSEALKEIRKILD